MAKYYGIFVKGTANVDDMLDLTSFHEFERTGNLKSNKLYYLKEIIKLTSKFDDECNFKYALFRNGLISLDDITKELSIRSKGDNNKAGKKRYPLIYRPLLDLFRPEVIRKKYISKFDVVENYDFLKALVNNYSGYRKPYQDYSRYTSEVIIDEINSIIKNYDPKFNFDREHTEHYREHKEYFNNKIKELLENFVNHEMFYVVGYIPNAYDRKLNNVYRKEKNSNKKSVDFYSLYKLISFLIDNDKNISLTAGKASDLELLYLKKEIICEIEEERVERKKYEEEAIRLAEEDAKQFSTLNNDCINNTISKKVKKKKRKIDNNIEGQITFFD